MTASSTYLTMVQTATVATPTLSTLVSFTGGNGSNPCSNLIADAAGNVFGTTTEGGAAGFGSVFEIANTATGYASTPITLVNFNGINGSNPQGNLATDAAGDLFGTAFGSGGAFNPTVFEIANTATGYASAPITLDSYDDDLGPQPNYNLVADAAGNLFQTDSETTSEASLFGGLTGDGLVFELAGAASRSASGAPAYVNFNGSDGNGPFGALIVDAAGDLFGTTMWGGAADDGTVFEIANTATGYASIPTTLFSFNGSNGSDPEAGLVADAAGDLFGTTRSGGAADDGTVFEITNAGFVGASSAPQVRLSTIQPTATDVSPAILGTVVSSNGTDPLSVSLISDADFAAGSSLGLSCGALVYTPAAITNGQVGSDRLEYTITDTDTLASITQTQTITLGNLATVADATSGLTSQAAMTPYSGPVVGLVNHYAVNTTDTLNVTPQAPDSFIEVGAAGGQRPLLGGINVSAVNGDNVLDSYANSVFYIDGTGVDQNYLSSGTPSRDQWNTVVNFHSGDNVTLWGVTRQDFALSWIGDTQGAAGATGLTGVFVPSQGGPDIGVTLTGFQMADLTNGRLSIGYQTQGSSPYASIHAN